MQCRSDVLKVGQVDQGGKGMGKIHQVSQGTVRLQVNFRVHLAGSGMRMAYNATGSAQWPTLLECVLAGV
ncbi:hypothetical protein TALK_15700 [Thalassospira alkalitolerans]|uniref:Uncharacterized protein n=1 Tax=Thalassospira alkalitolerans TaxID=1293890 RepID=A0A1Y2L8I2_9PROT|nr:hypothetical protein TALK_15700 [Thalassospira alkalitolerans]|tara:strand:+ start:32546 stop:32755 length:210 start_codon:yes stop_codon:yes gene_type:complete